MHCYAQAFADPVLEVTMDPDLDVLKSLLPIAAQNNGGRIDLEALAEAAASVQQRIPDGHAHSAGALADYQTIALDGLASFVDIRDKTVLEVGSDDGGNVLIALEERGAKFALGIDAWKKKGWFRVLSGKLVHAHGNVRSLPYRDESFDVLLNIATFEHIRDLDTTIHEMHRLLKPKGVMYAQFGPIWSSAVGHHIWCRSGDRIFRFNDPALNPLDDFDHLLYDRKTLAEKLSNTWDGPTVNHLVKAVFDHAHINRLFQHEICDCMRRSPFEVVHMEKSWEMPVPPGINRRLRDRHGDRSDFSCAGMQIVLHKRDTR